MTMNGFNRERRATKLPRFTDKRTNRLYDISLVCTKCGYAVVKDSRTEAWEGGPCRLHDKYRCTGVLVTKKIDYGSAPA